MLIKVMSSTWPQPDGEGSRGVPSLCPCASRSLAPFLERRLRCLPLGKGYKDKAFSPEAPVTKPNSKTNANWRRKQCSKQQSHHRQDDLGAFYKDVAWNLSRFTRFTRIRPSVKKCDC
eukprot:1151866-Pelagomonas_calceolata.AAC.8